MFRFAAIVNSLARQNFFPKIKQPMLGTRRPLNSYFTMIYLPYASISAQILPIHPTSHRGTVQPPATTR